MKKVYIATLLLGLVLGIFLGGIEDANANRLRDLVDKGKDAAKRGKDKVGDLKKKWDDRKHPCPVCGRTTTLRSKCARCLAKASGDKAREVGGKVKKGYDNVKRKVGEVRQKLRERAHPCAGCGKTIHVGSRCCRCTSKIIKEKGSAAIRIGKERGRRLYDAARGKYRHVVDKIKDPEFRQKVGQTIGAVMEARRRIRDAKNRMVGKTFDKLAGMRLPGQSKTFGEFCSERLREKYPQLAEIGLCDDLAATATAAFTCDIGFLMREVEFIKKDGENMSVMGAIENSSPYDSSGMVKYLKIARATANVSHTMATGEDCVSAATSFLSAIEAVR